MTQFNLSAIWDHIREELKDKGIDLDSDCCETSDGSPMKVVCMAGGLSDSLEKMGKTTRDQVLMVRIDEDTRKKLDQWVETGAFKSRSEAAALFINEGLVIHAKELGELQEALNSVEDAKENLRRKAREVFRAGKESAPADEVERDSD